MFWRLIFHILATKEVDILFRGFLTSNTRI